MQSKSKHAALISMISQFPVPKIPQSTPGLSQIQQSKNSYFQTLKLKSPLQTKCIVRVLDCDRRRKKRKLIAIKASKQETSSATRPSTNDPMNKDSAAEATPSTQVK